MVESERPRVGRMEQPTKTEEPYRLWFEFLKLAISDPEITVNYNFYDAWGDYQTTDFNTWWRHNWLDLFAFDIGVYKITDFPKLLQDRRNEIIIRLPPHNYNPVHTYFFYVIRNCLFKVFSDHRYQSISK